LGTWNKGNKPSEIQGLRIRKPFKEKLSQPFLINPRILKKPLEWKVLKKETFG